MSSRNNRSSHKSGELDADGGNGRENSAQVSGYPDEDWGGVEAQHSMELGGSNGDNVRSRSTSRASDNLMALGEENDSSPERSAPPLGPPLVSPLMMSRNDNSGTRESGSDGSITSGSSPSGRNSRWSFIDDPMPEPDQIIRTTSAEGIVMEHWEEMNGVRLPPRRGKVAMVENILEVIQASVVGFKPSKSLGLLAASEMANGIDIEAPAAEIDLVVSGGGLKGYYGVGAVHVLLRHLNANNIAVRRVSGTSAGAWVCFFILTNMSAAYWLETYYALQRNPEAHVCDVYREIWHQWMKHVIPEDTYKKVCGRLFITTTVLTPWGLRENVISQYKSNDDIFEACSASSQIPYVTAKSFAIKFQGMYHLDGGLVNNCPIFKDGERRQLVMKLMDVEYPFRLLVSANDSCIEALSIRGGLVMKQFLEGGVHSESLAWVQAKDEKALATPMQRLRGRIFRNAVITPVAIIVIMLYRGTGLRDLRYSLTGIAKEAKLGDMSREVIPLDNTKDVFNTSTVGYIFTQVGGAITSTLRNLGWLM